MLCTRDLYGSDLNENRSKMDPLPCARSLNEHRLTFCGVMLIDANAVQCVSVEILYTFC